MRWVRLLLAVALLGGCRWGRDDDTLPPSAGTSASVDYSVPAAIDVAYVAKVMAALDRVYGDAIQTLARERAVTEEFLAHLGAIYTPQELEVAERAWATDDPPGLTAIRDRPQPPGTYVAQALRLDNECIIVAVRRDFRTVRSTEPPITFLALVPSESRHRLNPTPWVISFDGYMASPPGLQPEEPCAASQL